MNIVMTGTSSGIGKHLVQSLGTGGHQIHGLARSSQASLQSECRQRKISFHFTQGDVSNWENVRQWRTEVGQRWPHLDALICCAALQQPVGPAMSLDPLAWTSNLRVNLDGTFYCIRAFYDLLLRAQPRAKIICFSGGGASSPRPRFTAYGVAKTGVVRLVETLAEEWRGQPIDINAVAPGAIHTRMTEELLGLGPEVVGEKEYTRALEQTQNGGGSSVSKVLGLVNFLLSRESDHLSGKLISAQWDHWERWPEVKHQLRQTDIYTLRRITPKDRGEAWT